MLDLGARAGDALGLRVDRDQAAGAVERGAVELHGRDDREGVVAGAADDRRHHGGRLVEVENLLLARLRQLRPQRVAADRERVVAGAEQHRERLDVLELDAAVAGARQREARVVEVRVHRHPEAADAADLGAVGRRLALLDPGDERAVAVGRVAVVVDDQRVEAGAADDDERADAVRHLDARAREADDVVERAAADVDDVVAGAAVDLDRDDVARALRR